MSTMVAELYNALRKAGVDEQFAREAAGAVLAAIFAAIVRLG